MKNLISRVQARTPANYLGTAKRAGFDVPLPMAPRLDRVNAQLIFKQHDAGERPAQIEKLFPPMKRNALTTEDEMRQLERELMSLRARERQLLDEISSARSQLSREQGATPMVIMDGIHGLDPKRRAATEKQKQRMSAADANLARAERKLLEMAPTLRATVTKLKQSHGEAETNRVERCSALVSSAVESASSSRDEFESRQSKLSDLRRQLAELEKDLHRALTAPATLTESAEGRARLLLAAGETPSQAAAPSADARTKELISKQRTLEASIRLRERSVEEVRRVFARDVIQHLKPAMASTVQRIAEGYGIARAATADADRLRYAFSQATGADEVLPCFVFQPVPVPAVDVKDEFGFWLDEMRQQGYEV